MSDISRRGFVGAALAATAVPVLGTEAQDNPSTQDAVTVEKHVVFGKGGDLDLKLDIYRPPAGKEKRMATIHFHGGGFRGGSKDALLRYESRIRGGERATRRPVHRSPRAESAHLSSDPAWTVTIAGLPRLGIMTISGHNATDEGSPHR